VAEEIRMYSRYDKMKESLVVDTEDRLPYPDPLSLNFTKVINVRTFPTVKRSGKPVQALFLENIQKCLSFVDGFEGHYLLVVTLLFAHLYGGAQSS
jgi:S-adenosylmethionine:tRNA-ribosyltransferase-isomerase (queuine synthetase)